jgi:hypothetical protein
VLSLLNNRIAVGTVLVFDELINYNNYREHEVKALWEWLQESGAKLATLGVLGPLADNSYSMDLDVNEPNGEHPWFQQSVAFVVAEAPRPNTPPLMAGFQIPQQASQDPQPVVDQNDANAAHKIKDATERDVYPVEIEKHAEEATQTAQQAGPADLEDRPVIADESALKEELAAQATPQQGKTEIAVSDIESVIPLDELEEDPEGEVPQDQGQKNKRPRPLKLDVKQPADSVANLVRQPEGASPDGKTHHRDSTEANGEADEALTAELAERRKQQRVANEGLNTEGAGDAADNLAGTEERKRQQREADNGGAAGAQIADARRAAVKEAAEYAAELEERKRQEQEANLGASVASTEERARQKSRKVRKHRSTLDDGLDTLSSLH